MSENPSGRPCEAGDAFGASGGYITADLDHVALNCSGDPLQLAQWYSDVLRFCPIDFDAYRGGYRPFPSVRISARCILDFSRHPIRSQLAMQTTSASL